MLEFLLQAVDDVTMDQKTAITEAINTIVERRVAGENVGFKQCPRGPKKGLLF